MRRSAGWLLAMVIALGSAGCAGRNSSTDPDARARIDAARTPDVDVDAARRHHAAGVAHVRERRYADARSAFERALQADPHSGVARNNLGLTLFHLGRYFDAAREFRLAAKQLPDDPAPYNNLGLVFEHARQYDAAARHYQRALDLDPQNAAIAGNLARVRIRRGEHGPDLEELLRFVILHDERDEWVAWAQRQSALLKRPESVGQGRSSAAQ